MNYLDHNLIFTYCDVKYNYFTCNICKCKFFCNKINKNIVFDLDMGNLKKFVELYGLTCTETQIKNLLE